AAISFGFCPDLEIKKPFCKGYGLEYVKGSQNRGVVFLPAKELHQPWLVFQGGTDEVCNPDATKQYVSQVPGGQYIALPKVGHGFAKEKNWLTQFREAFAGLNQTENPKPEEHPAEISKSNVPVSDLPLVEVAGSRKKDQLAVIVTGDGGWASIDRDIGDYLASQGIAVVGFDSLKYFWKSRTPEGAAKDLDRVINHYLQTWKKSNAMVLG